MVEGYMTEDAANLKEWAAQFVNRRKAKADLDDLARYLRKWFAERDPENKIYRFAIIVEKWNPLPDDVDEYCDFLHAVVTNRLDVTEPGDISDMVPGGGNLESTCLLAGDDFFALSPDQTNKERENIGKTR
jgi:hypothetical protein